VRHVVVAAWVLMLVLGGAALAEESPGPLDGAWEMVRGTQTGADGTVVEISRSDRQALKIIGSGHFVYISQDGPEAFHGAHGGRCTIDGNQYTEHVEYASLEQMRGQSYTFEFRLEGDELRVQGRFGELELEEIWRRVR
jgi:hypothetical protein